MVRRTSPLPRPLPGLTVIQFTGLDAVQSQLPRDATTELVRVAPLAGAVWEVGDTEKVHDGGGAAACVTVTWRPAMVTTAERDCSAVFSAIVRVNCASPWPLVLSSVIHDTG